MDVFIFQAWRSSKFLVPVVLLCCLFAKLCPTLCDPKDCSPPGSSLHGISRARILGGLLFPSPGDLSNPRIKPRSLALAGRFFTTSATWEALFSFEHGYILPSSHQKIGQEKYGKFHISSFNAIFHRKKWWMHVSLASLMAQALKNLPAIQETWVPSLGWEDPLEKGMATSWY